MNYRIWLMFLGLTACAFPGLTLAAQPVAADKPDYGRIISNAAQRYQVDIALIRAVIKVESNFNANAVSRAGAVGLMQVMPSTAADYGVDSRDALFDPATNIDTGTRHLKRLLKKYRNISRALTAYNAGEGNEVGFRKTGAFLETRKYTVSVIKYYQQYRRH